MEKIEVSDGVGFWSSGDAVVIVWQAPARLARAKWFYHLAEEALSKTQGTVVMLQIILATSSPPDAPTREENQRTLKRLGARIRKIVSVPVGDAMWMSIVRTIMRTMYFVSGYSNMQLVAATEREGLDKLMYEASASTPKREAIVAGLAQLYRLLGLPPPRA